MSQLQSHLRQLLQPPADTPGTSLHLLRFSYRCIRHNITEYFKLLATASQWVCDQLDHFPFCDEWICDHQNFFVWQFCQSIQALSPKWMTVFISKVFIIQCSFYLQLSFVSRKLLSDRFRISALHALFFKKLQPFFRRLRICHDDINIPQSSGNGKCGLVKFRIVHNQDFLTS